MKAIATILGLILIAGCKTSMLVQFKLYLGDSTVIGKWSQESGPSQLTFSTTNDSVVNIRAANPKTGIYKIKAVKDGQIATAIINVSK